MNTMKVKLTLTEGLLGTSPFNEEIYRDFIGSKSPDASTVEDEVAALGVDAVTEKSMTGFPRDSEGKPFHSMKIYVCKSDEEAKEVFDEKKSRIMKPESKTDSDVWGEISGVSDAFGDTFVRRKENLVY